MTAGGWLHGVVALHGRVHQLGAAQVVVPVENVDDEVAQGKHNSGTIILSSLDIKHQIKADLDIRSILETELRGSSGSVMAWVIHLKLMMI